MTTEYERTIARTKAVLTEEHKKAMGSKGIEALYDAVMIMAFADGEIVDDEARFLNDFAEYLGTKGSDDDLTDDALLGRLSSLSMPPLCSEAFIKVILIVCDLDDDQAEDELKLWRDIGRALGLTNERMAKIRSLLHQARATTRKLDGDKT